MDSIGRLDSMTAARLVAYTCYSITSRVLSRPLEPNSVEPIPRTHLSTQNTSETFQISHLEKRYEEREHRLRAIVQGLAQKSVTNRSCEQCAVRQQQLIGYKTELDQLLATLRSLK